MRYLFLLPLLILMMNVTALASEVSGNSSEMPLPNDSSPETIMTSGDQCLALLDAEEIRQFNMKIARICNSKLNMLLALRGKDLSKQQSNAELWASARLRTSLFVITNRMTSPDYQSVFVSKLNKEGFACHQIYWAYNHLRDMKRPYEPVGKDERKQMKKIVKPAFKACFDVRAKPIGNVNVYKRLKDLRLRGY